MAKTSIPIRQVPWDDIRAGDEIRFGERFKTGIIVEKSEGTTNGKVLTFQLDDHPPGDFTQKPLRILQYTRWIGPLKAEEID